MDVDSYLRFLLALVFVLALIGLFALLLRRYGPTRLASARMAPGSRLSIIEVLPLDGRRRIVLVRRDQTEHLVLLGQTNDLVIEDGIEAPPKDDTPHAENNGGGGKLANFRAALKTAGRSGR